MWYTAREYTLWSQRCSHFGSSPLFELLLFLLRPSMVGCWQVFITLSAVCKLNSFSTAIEPWGNVKEWGRGGEIWDEMSVSITSSFQAISWSIRSAFLNLLYITFLAELLNYVQALSASCLGQGAFLWHLAPTYLNKTSIC